jgi:hypothetical protein
MDATPLSKPAADVRGSLVPVVFLPPSDVHLRPLAEHLISALKQHGFDRARIALTKEQIERAIHPGTKVAVMPLSMGALDHLVRQKPWLPPAVGVYGWRGRSRAHFDEGDVRAALTARGAAMASAFAVHWAPLDCQEHTGLSWISVSVVDSQGGAQLPILQVIQPVLRPEDWRMYQPTDGPEARPLVAEPTVDARVRSVATELHRMFGAHCSRTDFELDGDLLRVLAFHPLPLLIPGSWLSTAARLGGLEYGEFVQGVLLSVVPSLASTRSRGSGGCGQIEGTL